MPYKAWKLTDEDWRNRDKWEEYETAVEDMLLKTSTRTAPWTIVEGNDKWYARVKTLRTLVEVLSKELDYQPDGPDQRQKSKGKREKDAQAPCEGFKENVATQFQPSQGWHEINQAMCHSITSLRSKTCSSKVPLSSAS